MIISQNQQIIEKYSKNKEQKWVLTETDDDHPAIRIESIGCMLELSEVYDKTED